ncbi:protein of unknown function [Methanoculleus bourgensis]|uniref:BREX system Lon protease-like BrxL N-terminal domain-containing protein n=1 Tax=Methanoculleus bourgensis TaxID=83986 RepID=A0A0X3BLX8_9EURY|nr:protein of unknown function [Methanoculleus bourgensis]
MNSGEHFELDELDRKLVAAFPGRVVRKDLVHKLKVGFSIPVYVLEYLLGKYCSTTDEKGVNDGLQLVKSAIAERVVRADQGELIKARLKRSGSMKIIDLVTVTFDEKDQGGKYWAHLATSGLDKVHIEEDFVEKYERVLTGGVWSNIELVYDENIVHGNVTRPFVIANMKPIQIASARMDEWIEARRQFTREEWVNILLRSIGYEPTHPDLTWRVKMLILLRLIPMVEKNYNLIELGPVKQENPSYIVKSLPTPYSCQEDKDRCQTSLDGRTGRTSLAWSSRMIWWHSTKSQDHTSRTKQTSRYSRATWNRAHSHAATTKGPSPPRRASSSMATSTATSSRLPGHHTSSPPCQRRSGTTRHFMTGGMPTSLDGRC